MQSFVTSLSKAAERLSVNVEFSRAAALQAALTRMACNLAPNNRRIARLDDFHRVMKSRRTTVR